MRIALASLPFPKGPEESIARVERAIAQAGARGARLVAFPECYVPGYRGMGNRVARPDARFLKKAWARVAAAAKAARVTAVVGTEREIGRKIRPCVLVAGPGGRVLGFQDKVQLDPTEDAIYSPGSSRRLFTSGGLTFGVVICHEGWRYPETARWAARRGAKLVLHPHFHKAEPGGYRGKVFAHPSNTFHEAAIRCRAAESTIFFASVNCAGPGSPVATAIADPDGNLLARQPYGKEGLLVADLDLSRATRLLASRCKYC
ncbi:MAG: carbon-nitrogen hydrolase family protein [Proteobacteria bacterium]|nr:carbon-nitrogen hydrolase family protein [Pseudomonadota bacterium]